MIAQLAVDDARELLKDIFTPPRYPDAEMIKWINFGQFKIVRKRPDALWTSTSISTSNEPVTIAALTEELSINAFMTEALVHLICYRCLMKDSEDAANKDLAITYLKLAEATINGRN